MQTVRLSEDKQEVRARFIKESRFFHLPTDFSVMSEILIRALIAQVFETLQGKYAEYRKQLMITTSKLSQADMERKRNRLTLFELDKLPEGTATFKAVGKMFISVPSANIMEECTTSAEGVPIRFGVIIPSH
jgi:chaperonin cofactor prefoldin